DADTVTTCCQRDTFRIQLNMYPLGLYDFAHSLGDIFVFTSNQARAHLHNRDFAAEAPVDLTEFQSDGNSSYDDEMIGHEVDIHDRGVGEKWNIMDPWHLGNRSASTYIDVNVVGLQNFIIDRHSIRRLEAGMALDYGAIFRSTQQFLYSFVRPPGDRILTSFYALHIHAHILGDKTIFSTAACNVGSISAGNQRFSRDASCVYTGAAKLVTFDNGDGLAHGSKPRSQRRAGLARPDDDGVEVLHAARALSM